MLFSLTCKSRQSGFTLVEMLVIAPIVVIAISIFIGLLLGMSNEAGKTQVENAVVYEVQDALRTIERDIRLSSRFLAGNEFTVNTWQNYNPGDGVGYPYSYQNVGPRGNMLILRGLTTNINPLDPNRQLVYNNDNPVGDSDPTDDPACQPDKLLTNSFNTVNIVYFVRDIGDGYNSLWRRVLVDYSDTTCSTPWQKGTCAPTTTDPECPAKDMRLIDNVADFSIGYYMESRDTAPNPTATNTSLPASDREEPIQNAPAVRVTITGRSTVGGKNVDHTGSIHSARMNVTQSD